ncbi:MAG: hypothetical protein LC118_18025 [Dehalococcoidia bacterium]|nr:hypothetical protein [Dehalococcoidia bacterium]
MRLEFPVEGERVRLDERDGAICIVRRSDDCVVGHVELEGGEAAVTVRALCIDESYRSYGCGSETGFLLVSAARQAGYACLKAWAPPDRGLAVYFWFRMGLHPLHGEGPAGGIWLEKDFH